MPKSEVKNKSLHQKADNFNNNRGMWQMIVDK